MGKALFRPQSQHTSRVIPIVALVILGITLSCYLLQPGATTQSYAALAVDEAPAFNAAPIRSSWSREQAAEDRARLMAPVLFPHLYPECGRIVHPPLPTTPEEKRGLYKSQAKEDQLLYETLYKDDTEPGVSRREPQNSYIVG